MRLTVLNVSYPLACVSAATPGGAEQVLSILDEELVRAGHRSIVVAPEGSRISGVLLSIRAFSSALDDNAKRESRRCCRAAIESALQKFSIDVIHFHGIDFYDYLPACDIPILVTLHLPPAWYPPEIFRWQRENVHLICVSAAQARACPPHAHIETIICNGIALQLFTPSLTKENYALCLGRICPEKGFHFAMDACTSAGLPLFLAGTVFPYPEHQQYFEDFIRPRLKIGHRYLGAVMGQQKQRLLAHTKCLIIPSLVDETSSLVAMEAAASGTPVIAFRRGALPEVVRHGHTGLIVDNPEQMALALGSISSISPADCRAEAIHRFDGRRMAAEYISLYSRFSHRYTLIRERQEMLRC
jgi:glycosyltransferase involved in cell wall biosynthesis